MIGKDIYNQLKFLGKMDLMAWGSRNFKVIKEDCFTEDIPHRGGLFFQVSGLLHKKKVLIRCQGNDLYNIEIGEVRKGKWVKRKKSKTMTNIYFDQMINVIDSLVEGTLAMTSQQAEDKYKEEGVLVI